MIQQSYAEWAASFKPRRLFAETEQREEAYVDYTIPSDVYASNEYPYYQHQSNFYEESYQVPQLSDSFSSNDFYEEDDEEEDSPQRKAREQHDIYKWAHETIQQKERKMTIVVGNVMI